MFCIEKGMNAQNKVPCRNWLRQWWLKLREKQFPAWLEEGKCSLLVSHFILTHEAGSFLDQPGCNFREFRWAGLEKFMFWCLEQKLKVAGRDSSGRELKWHSSELRTNFGCDLGQLLGWVSSLLCKGGEQLGQAAKQLCRTSEELLKSSSMKTGVCSLP